MIFVQRTTKPKILRKNEKRWVLAIRKALITYRAAPTKSNKDVLDRTKEKYRQSKIKDQLCNMFSGKCAYCESAVTHIDWGHIEHFRPKDTYPLLAVDWDNLLLACAVCNGASYKGTKFPLDAQGNPLLINPCLDNPETHLDFEYDARTNHFLVVGKDDKGITSVRVYGLNRHRDNNDLQPFRNKQLAQLLFIAFHYNKDSSAKELLDKACEKDAPYAAFARMIRKKYT